MAYVLVKDKKQPKIVDASMKNKTGNTFVVWGNLAGFFYRLLCVCEWMIPIIQLSCAHIFVQMVFFEIYMQICKQNLQVKFAILYFCEILFNMVLLLLMAKDP